jgi:hypothetical protein
MSEIDRENMPESKLKVKSMWEPQKAKQNTHRAGRRKGEQIAEPEKHPLFASWQNQRGTQPEVGLWGQLQRLRTTTEPIQRHETSTRFSRLSPARICRLNRGSPWQFENSTVHAEFSGADMSTS